jgi:hypothetical protein
MDEIKAMEKIPDHKNKYDNMSLMDSFLKETARLNPIVTGMRHTQFEVTGTNSAK